MKPIDAYQDTAVRARTFVRLYEGLINTRQRSIRADWKRSFCQLMHWPQSSNLERVDSRDAVIVLRHGASLVSSDFTRDSLRDLLRSAITYGVSALDRYVHERVIKGFVAAFRAAKLTKQQSEFQMPVTLSIDIARNVHAARRENNNHRPANEIRKSVQTTLHKRPFQNWREIEYAFALIGFKNLAKSIRNANSVNVLATDAMREDLNKIVARRNQIVHEGDLSRHQRGGGVTAQAISKKWVVDSLNFLDDFVSHLEKV